MTGWRPQPCTLAAICSLLVLALPATAGQSSQTSHVGLPALHEPEAGIANQQLSGQPDAQLHIASLHQTAQLGEVNGTKVNSSVSYNLSGVKSGLPAVCYGQLCNASACYPSATISVKRHVNYVKVTALVEFSRRHIVSLSCLSCVLQTHYDITACCFVLLLHFQALILITLSSTREALLA